MEYFRFLNNCQAFTTLVSIQPPLGIEDFPPKSVDTGEGVIAMLGSPAHVVCSKVGGGWAALRSPWLPVTWWGEPLGAFTTWMPSRPQKWGETSLSAEISWKASTGMLASDSSCHMPGYTGTKVFSGLQLTTTGTTLHCLVPGLNSFHLATSAANQTKLIFQSSD